MNTQGALPLGLGVANTVFIAGLGWYTYSNLNTMKEQMDKMAGVVTVLTKAIESIESSGVKRIPEITAVLGKLDQEMRGLQAEINNSVSLKEFTDLLTKLDITGDVLKNGGMNGIPTFSPPPPPPYMHQHYYQPPPYMYHQPPPQYQQQQQPPQYQQPPPQQQEQHQAPPAERPRRARS